MSKNLYLIFINPLGENFKGYNEYEFIFSDTITDVEADGWDYIPASGQPEVPDNKFIKRVGVLETELNFDLIQESTCHGMWHAIDKVIALAWENIIGYSEYPDKILSFHFGDALTLVESRLYEKDLKLNYKK